VLQRLVRYDWLDTSARARAAVALAEMTRRKGEITSRTTSRAVGEIDATVGTVTAHLPAMNGLVAVI
jgi:hypothetical protein